MTRDKFREAVFARDKYTCVLCQLPAQDAHHILERRLFPDGGYYVSNGSSVCGQHHIECETTDISVEQLRLACNITRPILPPHLYSDQPYDKWGNPILPNGQRLRGDLFYDPSVQKILAQGGKLSLFTNWVKYPRTYHLPWSQGLTTDDRRMESLDAFIGKRVIVSVKMDGENSSMYHDYFHARSVDGNSHPSRNWVKQFHSQIAADIPEGWRICGENLFAKHSIAYNNLPTYFMGFSIWDDKNSCLSWDDTKYWFELLGIQHVPILYDGIFNEDLIKNLWIDKRDRDTVEGYVLRLADEIGYSEFRIKFGKFVRKNHVAATVHNWQQAMIVKNKLA